VIEGILEESKRFLISRKKLTIETDCKGNREAEKSEEEISYL